jgi:hypothetical protein
MGKVDPGFQAALDAAKGIIGKDWGAATWLASQTGVSRQALDSWKRLGIPEHMLPEVAKVTGLPIKKIASTRLRAAAAAYRKMF